MKAKDLLERFNCTLSIEEVSRYISKEDAEYNILTHECYKAWIVYKEEKISMNTERHRNFNKDFVDGCTIEQYKDWLLDMNIDTFLYDINCSHLIKILL